MRQISPYREAEAIADGSDAIADWPLLNTLLNTAKLERVLTNDPGMGLSDTSTPATTSQTTSPNSAAYEFPCVSGPA